jgi:hypothetical protein
MRGREHEIGGDRDPRAQVAPADDQHHVPRHGRVGQRRAPDHGRGRRYAEREAGERR